jgi:hypothetical protein
MFRLHKVTSAHPTNAGNTGTANLPEPKKIIDTKAKLAIIQSKK